MAVKAEQKIAKLENELQALKATYSVYGGAMLSYISFSPTYDAGDQLINARVKFTPDIKPRGNLLVASIRCDVDNDNFFSSYAVPAVQDGSGSIIIQAPIPGGTFSFSLVSTSPGTFTRLQ